MHKQTFVVKENIFLTLLPNINRVRDQFLFSSFFSFVIDSFNELSLMSPVVQHCVRISWEFRAQNVPAEDVNKMEVLK